MSSYLSSLYSKRKGAPGKVQQQSLKVFTLKNCIPEFLLPYLTLRLLHKMERAKTHWGGYSACKLTCCSVVVEGKKECSCCVRSRSSLLPLFFTVRVHPGSQSCGPGTSSMGWAGKGALLWGMHTDSVSVPSTVPHIAFPMDLYCPAGTGVVLVKVCAPRL